MARTQRAIRGVSRGAFPTAFLALLALACSSDGTGAKGEIEPLVGTWRAQALTLTNRANPSMVVDLIAEGATFTLSILSTGQYSALMVAFGFSRQEVGTIKVEGNQITITPTSPPGPPTVGTWKFEGDVLVLDGDTEYDFNQDGQPEAARAHFELVRLSS